MNHTKNTQLDALVTSVGNLNRDQQNLLEQALKASRSKPSSSRFFARKFMGAAAALVILAGGSVAVWAAVDDDWGTSDVIAGGIVVPYDGFLMLGSDAADGTREVIFELWDDEASTAPGNLIWSETQTVDFFNGRFSVGLGTGEQASAKTIDEAVLDGEQLYLAVQVKDGTGIDTGGEFVPLAGRQAIEAVPYSAWSANAADFTVQGLLDAKGNVDVAGNTTVTGTLDSKNKVGISTSHHSNYNLWVQGSDTSEGTGDARNLALLGTSEAFTDNEDLLYVNYGAEYSGGLILDSNTTVDGNLTADSLTTGSGTFTGAMSYPSQVVGGGQDRRNASSTTYYECASWGSGSCSSGNVFECPSGTTKFNQFDGDCYPARYCYSFLCIRD